MCVVRNASINPVIRHVALQMEVGVEAIDVDDIPIESLDLSEELKVSKGIDGLASADRYYLESVAAEKNKKKKRYLLVYLLYFFVDLYICITYFYIIYTFIV